MTRTESSRESKINLYDRNLSVSLSTPVMKTTCFPQKGTVIDVRTCKKVSVPKTNTGKSPAFSTVRVLSLLTWALTRARLLDTPMRATDLGLSLSGIERQTANKCVA